MLPEPVASLPTWLIAGVALGGILATVAAGVFVVGLRLFPDGGRDRRGGRDGGERRRRAEVRDYLSAIGEPFVEDHPIAGRPAAFFLPRRDVVITFDARDYFRFERAGVRAVLLEFELPGAGIGSRLPFETPDPDPGERATGGRSGSRDPRAAPSGRAAFAALGLSTGASEDDVRAAYRERVKEVHPDHGGDADSFRQLREAYSVALERAR